MIDKYNYCIFVFTHIIKVPTYKLRGRVRSLWISYSAEDREYLYKLFQQYREKYRLLERGLIK